MTFTIAPLDLTHGPTVVAVLALTARRVRVEAELVRSDAISCRRRGPELVATAAANAPALALHAKHGFAPSARHTVGGGLEIVQLRRPRA